MALDLARDYFNEIECGITSYYLEQKKIVDAQFLKVSEDQTMCYNEQPVGCQSFIK